MKIQLVFLELSNDLKVRSLILKNNFHLPVTRIIVFFSLEEYCLLYPFLLIQVTTESDAWRNAAEEKIICFFLDTRLWKVLEKMSTAVNNFLQGGIAGAATCIIF